MAGLGETLRAERERRGLTLDEAERATRIRKRYLAALESEDAQAMPGEVYLRGFVRNYAAYLGLDPRPLLEQLPRTERAPALEPATRFERPPSGLLGWMVVLILLAGAAGGGLYLYRESGIAPLPEPVSSPVVFQVPTLAATAAALPTPVPTTLMANAPGPVVTPSRALPVSPASRPAASAGGFNLQFRAVERTWIASVVDGFPSFTGTLEIGDQRVFTATKLIVTTIGNAGGLEVTLSGRRLGPLGRPGQVLRDVEWTATGVQIPTPTVAPPATTPPLPPSPSTGAATATPKP